MKDKAVSPARYDERYYAESCGGGEFFRAYGPKVLKPPLTYALRRSELKAGMRVLDIGCGRGEILYHVRRAAAQGVGADFSPAALALAARTSGCPVLLCDAKSLPFSAGTFDRVFFVGVIDHLRDWELERCFAEIGRVLRPGGAVLVYTCANRLYYKNWTYGLRRALAAAARRVGLAVREPARPRSEEDLSLHVNEHSFGTLASFFRRIGWEAVIEPRPNDKFTLQELYGELPPDFPLRPAPRWKIRLFMALCFRFPLNRALAREFFVLARPRS